jgi:signal transduction histidine kinase
VLPDATTDVDTALTRAAAGGARPVGRWWPEVALTTSAFAFCLLGGVLRVDGSVSAPPAAAYLVAVVCCVVLPARRRAPSATLAMTTVGAMLAQPLGLLLSPLTAVPAAIAAYALAGAARPLPGTAFTEWRVAGAVSLSASGLLAASVVTPDDLSWRDASRVVVVAAVPLVAGVLGHSVRTRRAYLQAWEDRARQAEQSRDSEARQRVAEERVRIARELHDLVAHQITLANAQATVAAHLLDTRPDQARKSLRELVETTRHALDELRATVGLLRQSGDADTTAEPAPGLSRLPALVESFHRAALEVSVHVEGAARPLPPGLDLAAYRIVQESLTNVAKHAGTGSARVRLSWEPGHLTVVVADDGTGVRAMPGGPPGHGLIGMRERAVAVGGQLTAGGRPEGGFLVRARLPLPAARTEDRS